MLVLLTVEPKWTLAASYAVPGESRRVCRQDRQTDERTPDRYITLSARRGQRNNNKETSNIADGGVNDKMAINRIEVAPSLSLQTLFGFYGGRLRVSDCRIVSFLAAFSLLTVCAGVTRRASDVRRRRLRFRRIFAFLAPSVSGGGAVGVCGRRGNEFDAGRRLMTGRDRVLWSSLGVSVAGVCPKMSLQLVGSRKPLAAEQPRADERTLARVPVQVRLQVRRLRVDLAASRHVAGVLAQPPQLFADRSTDAVRLPTVGAVTAGAASSCRCSAGGRSVSTTLCRLPTPLGSRRWLTVDRLARRRPAHVAGEPEVVRHASQFLLAVCQQRRRMWRKIARVVPAGLGRHGR